MKHQKKNPALVPPAITVCADSAKNSGWKGATFRFMGLNTTCDMERGFEETNRCVKNKTYNLEETIDVSAVALKLQTLPFSSTTIEEKLWKSTITAARMGMCHTLAYSEPIDLEKHLQVTMKGEFTVFLHDPSFFVLKSDNFFIPHLTLNGPSKKGYKLKVVTKKRMNRKGIFECQSDPGYSYSECVKESVAKKIGCNGPWVDHIVDSLPVCNSTKDILDYSFWFYQIYLADEHKLEELTDCQVCISSNFGLTLTF